MFFKSGLDRPSNACARILLTSKLQTTSSLALLLLFPPIAWQTPTKIPSTPVRNIELIHPISQPRFPDRTKQHLEAVAYDAQKAAEQAEAQRQADIAAQQAQVAYTAPTQPVVAGNCQTWMAAAGIVDQTSAYQLIMRESGCNPNSRNASSGACGIGQQLPCGKWPHQWNDPVGAMIDMQVYVMGKYGSWANALGHSLANNWY